MPLENDNAGTAGEENTGTAGTEPAPGSTTDSTAAGGGTSAGGAPATGAGSTNTTTAAQEGATNSVPESYEFVAPEGVTFDETLLKDVEAFAREHSLPNASAQKIADMGVKLQANFTASLDAAVKAQVSQWQETLRADPELGGEKLEENRGVAALAVTTYFPELNEYLEKSGLMHNPDLIRGLVKIGRTLKEDSPPGGSENRPQQTGRKPFYTHPTSKHAA